MLPWILMLAATGLLLVIAEILVPGFGVFGILGAIALFCSTTMIALSYGTVAFMVTVAVLIVLLFLFFKVVKTTNLYKKFILTDKMEEKDFDESTIQGLQDKEGITLTPLKPYGKAEFAGEVFDVSSEGEFVGKNRPIKVMHISGKNVVVKEM